MTTIAGAPFERLDNNDSTVAVDGLSEFFPAQTRLEVDSAPLLDDSALTLDDLFPQQAAVEIDDYFSFAGDATLAAAPSESMADMPVDDDEDFESEQLVQSDEVFQSEIQRAAVEFQRFADKFHAFASECQQRATVRHRLI
jgi:hypothetical protein